MLVNASTSPALALWHGVMLIIAAAWAAWLFSDLDRSSKQVKISLIGIVIFGIAFIPISIWLVS